MGSPLSLVIAKFFMEDFDKMALDLVAHKPIFCLRYVDGISVIWSQCSDRLQNINYKRLKNTRSYRISSLDNKILLISKIKIFF